MPSNPENRKFSFTISSKGEFVSIRGLQVPKGSIAAPNLVAISPESREVTPRAIKLTAGIFDFARRANQQEPTEDKR